MKWLTTKQWGPKYLLPPLKKKKFCLIENKIKKEEGEEEELLLVKQIPAINVALRAKI